MKSGINLKFVDISTPTPQPHWLSLSPVDRKKTCQLLLDKQQHALDVINANERGEVIVQCRRSLSPGERGTVLLDAEETLKQHDASLVVYLEATADKNALRKFRGITIHDDRH